MKKIDRPNCPLATDTTPEEPNISSDDNRDVKLNKQMLQPHSIEQYENELKDLNCIFNWPFRKV